MTILDSTVTINGKEYVLFYTQADYEYTDLEIALHICLKSDLEKIKEEYPEIEGECIYPARPFLEEYQDLKEIAESYYHTGDTCYWCDECFKNNPMKSDYIYVCAYDEHEANDTWELYEGCKNPEKI